MAKRNESLGYLADLSKVEKVLKKSDRIFWTKDGQYDVVATPYWVMKIIVPTDSKFKGTLYTLFDGKIPTDDVVLTRAKAQKNVEESRMDIKSFLRNKGYELPVSYTRMMVEADKDVAGLYICTSTKTIIAINKSYTDMVSECESITSEDGTAFKPLFFNGRNSETLMLLPMRITMPRWIDEKAE